MSSISVRRFDPSTHIPYKNLFDPGVSIVETRGFEFETRPTRLSLRTVLAGQTTYEFSGMSRTLRAGDILLVGTAAPLVGATARDKETTCLSIYLSSAFDVPALADDLAPLFLHIPAGQRGLSAAVDQLTGAVMAGGGAEEVEHFFENVEAEAALVLNHCALVSERLPVQKPQTRLRHYQKLERARAFMAHHLSGPLRVEDAAREAGMSRTHFSILFEKAYGQTPRVYHEQMRHQAARRQVLRTARPLAEIADAFGYSSPATFARAFQRQEGISARALRRRYS